MTSHRDAERICEAPPHRKSVTATVVAVADVDAVAAAAAAAAAAVALTALECTREVSRLIAMSARCRGISVIVPRSHVADGA